MIFLYPINHQKLKIQKKGYSTLASNKWTILGEIKRSKFYTLKTIKYVEFFPDTMQFRSKLLFFL